ncbi:MAG TPA: DUF3035 domain-containing protein [Stellaceae bacterium]|nr:DUF3035 domain-containing protein [Stellaceae bacterium]
MTRLRSLPVVGCVAAGLLLAGCSNWKQTLGIEPTSPDEFAVESRAPLTIPPDFNLRPPAPGAPRPQEVSAASKAQGVIENAGPGTPGNQAQGTLQFKGTNLANPEAQIADQSLAAKLLQTGDSGATVEKRETTALQGVY